MKTLQSRDNLIWIDLEMTGLDPDKEKIIEIATLVTDSDLNIVAEGPNIIINQSLQILDAMDEWNQNQHGSSGLIDEVKKSDITEQIAEIDTLDFISKYVGEKVSPMCGNTVSHDRRFLRRYMPEVESFFHYRNVDVSSIKELLKRWNPELLDGYKKKGGHRAMADVLESIEELKFYKENFFI